MRLILHTTLYMVYNATLCLAYIIEYFTSSNLNFSTAPQFCNTTRVCTYTWLESLLNVYIFQFRINLQYNRWSMQMWHKIYKSEEPLTSLFTDKVCENEESGTTAEKFSKYLTFLTTAAPESHRIKCIKEVIYVFG